MLSQESRRLAGILLVVLPTVMYGGVSLLMWLTNPDSGYMQNPLRQNLFRAGHAHAGVLLVLSLVALRYVDEAPAFRGMEKICAVLDCLGCHFASRSIFLFRAVPSRHGAERLHLLGIHRRTPIGGWTLRSWSGPFARQGIKSKEVSDFVRPSARSTT